MKELVMGLFRDTDRVIANITSGREVDQSFAEEQEKIDAAIQQVLAEAALKNQVTEAGRLFKVKVPEEDLSIDEIDLRTQGSSDALALERNKNTISFQATKTSALVKYIDLESILNEWSDDQQMVADYPHRLSNYRYTM